MLKNILNLEGAFTLTSNEQKSIKGGITKVCADVWSHSICYTKPATGCPVEDADGNSIIEACGKCCY
ncbi:hypothetical protein [Flavobacterium sp. H122]|uniref:hypothetical protein n=1 Tax=Flavobacterium sp. H122 TaxID=2529860 RepID=UPI0010A9D582|nr:hypothetical protein [Flavobacterium sp. H122]